MECGFARDLFLQWCTNPKNSVILTSRSSPGTLARQLIAHQGDRDRVIPLEVRRRIRLNSLRDFCSEVVEGENNIFVPKNGEWVDATTERFIYQVRLRDSLFSTLKFSKAKDAQLAWLDGVIKMTDDERTDLKPLEEEEGEELRSKPEIPMLNPLPEESVQGHSTNFVNELKLSDFKLVLTRNGIPSEFQMGNLLCGHQSNIQLKRHDSGRVMIEGCVSDEYYLIRDLLYQQYAIV